MGQVGADPFEGERRRLTGLAYRLLGSRAEAEDAVQDTFLRWQDADRAAVENPAAWLTTACTRRCLDLLRSARRKRVDYVGAWLPEPVHTAAEDSPEATVELASSLSTAFLLLLERLTPKERAAYLLHEIFERPYPDVAAALGMQEAACRKLVSRAKAVVGRPAVRQAPPRDRQQALLAAFRDAIASGRTERFAAMLSDDITLSADGGGRVTATRDPVQGRGDVLDFVIGPLRAYWAGYEWVPTEVNGGLGLLLVADGHLSAAVTFGFDETGRVSGIFIMRNPDKLSLLAAGALPVS